jgi:hypothetical protein
MFGRWTSMRSLMSVAGKPQLRTAKPSACRQPAALPHYPKTMRCRRNPRKHIVSGVVPTLIWINGSEVLNLIKYWSRAAPNAGRSLQRYFFTIRGRDLVEDDREGKQFSDVATALSYAEHTIRELREKSDRIDLTLTMVVQNQARQTVLFLPFFPGS